MKSRKYETPSMETITFADENIITTSDAELFNIQGVKELPEIQSSDFTNILN